MSTDVITEKVYCDGGKGSCNDMAWLAAQNNNNMFNNPWAYIMMMWLMRAWGGNGWGENSGESYNSRQIAALQGTVNDNHNNDLVMQAINGNRDALGQLAQTFNTDITAIQQGICGVKAAIEQVGGAVGYSAERVINAVNLGDQNIVQQLCNCCCQTKTAILEQGYQNQLANERQTGILGSKMDANHAADQLQDCQYHGQTISRIDQLANGIQSGFAQIGFQAQQNTQSIIQNATANTQRILDQMCANTTQELRDKLAQMSQEAQTQTIINQLRGCGCGCGSN